MRRLLEKKKELSKISCDKMLVGEIILLFIFASFIGYIIEEVWFFMRRGYFESRASVLYGPFSAVYGFSVCAVTLVLHRLKRKNWLTVFIISFIFATLTELVFSMMQELFFGSFGWSYDSLKINFDGRICLLYSFYWGLLGIFWIKVIYPTFRSFVYKIPNKTRKVLTFVLAVFMIGNIIISCAAGSRMKDRNKGIKASTKIEHFLDENYSNDYIHSVITSIRD